MTTTPDPDPLAEWVEARARRMADEAMRQQPIYAQFVEQFRKIAVIDLTVAVPVVCGHDGCLRLRDGHGHLGGRVVEPTPPIPDPVPAPPPRPVDPPKVTPTPPTRTTRSNEPRITPPPAPPRRRAAIDGVVTPSAEPSRFRPAPVIKTGPDIRPDPARDDTGRVLCSGCDRPIDAMWCECRMGEVDAAGVPKAATYAAEFGVITDDELDDCETPADIRTARTV